ncbi:MAG: DNA-directed RNA polymerase subunit delta [Aerococcaceae bacterium]|nr:DNA-directed RNA polymerase subunit delta [Aerococcaceae bacterium]
MELKQFEGQQKSELSMIEVAYALLENKGDVIEFTELLILVQEYLELNEAQLEARMARFYTDLNVNGSFISLGDNRWGLRAWYPIDSIDEEIITSAEEEQQPLRRRKKRKYNAFGDDEDMIDYNDDDPEDMEVAYDEDDIDYDAVEEDDEDDDLVGLSLVVDEDDEEEDEELSAYASDLSEFGDVDDEEIDVEVEDNEEEE